MHGAKMQYDSQIAAPQTATWAQWWRTVMVLWVARWPVWVGMGLCALVFTQGGSILLARIFGENHPWLTSLVYWLLFTVVAVFFNIIAFSLALQQDSGKQLQLPCMIYIWHAYRPMLGMQLAVSLLYLLLYLLMGFFVLGVLFVLGFALIWESANESVVERFFLYVYLAFILMTVVVDTYLLPVAPAILTENVSVSAALNSWRQTFGNFFSVFLLVLSLLMPIILLSLLLFTRGGLTFFRYAVTVGYFLFFIPWRVLASAVVYHRLRQSEQVEYEL